MGVVIERVNSGRVQGGTEIVQIQLKEAMYISARKCYLVVRVTFWFFSYPIHFEMLSRIMSS